MGTPQRILLVDDDPGILQMLEAGLDSPDRRVESACDGKECLRRVETAVYDLIITDIELLECIHRVRPNAKVAVMTRANTPQNILRALREHAFTLFSKPFAVETVCRSIERVLDSTPGRTT